MRSGENVCVYVICLPGVVQGSEIAHDLSLLFLLFFFLFQNLVQRHADDDDDMKNKLMFE